MDGSSIIDLLQFTDEQATLLMNGINMSWSDDFWMMISNKGFWYPTYGLCMYFLFKRLGWRRALAVLASVFLAIVLCDQLANMVKGSVNRLRPNYSFKMLNCGLNILEKRGGYYGFFSAHAANAFACAICLIIGFRNDSRHTYNAFCLWALIWATLVAVSRIFVGKHYLGDVLTGILVGTVVGLSIGKLSRFLIRKFLGKEDGPREQEVSSPSESPSIP